MKQILKKVSSVCAALVCAVALTTAGAVTVAADSEIDETIKSQIVMTAEGLTETIIPLSDEEIDAYMNSGDEFTENAISSWASSKEELGEFKETKDAEVTYANGEYTVTVPGEFEKADANFVYVFDENAIPTSMNVDVQYSMGVTLQRAGLNTLMGIGIVFLMLVFLSFVIYLFRFIPALLEGKKKGSGSSAGSSEGSTGSGVGSCCGRDCRRHRIDCCHCRSDCSFWKEPAPMDSLFVLSVK